MAENYDPFAWLREARRKISARFGHDIRRYCAYLREREKELPESRFVKIEKPTPPTQLNRSSNEMSDSYDLIQRIVSESHELSFRMRVELIRRLASDTLGYMDALAVSANGDLHDHFDEADALEQFLNETSNPSITSLDDSDVPF